MTYLQLLELNKVALQVKLIKIIDNNTMRVEYSFNTNVHCDFGIQKDFMRSLFTSKKSLANKTIQQYQKVKGKKFKLAATDNSLGYTRLIYTLG